MADIIHFNLKYTNIDQNDYIIEGSNIWYRVLPDLSWLGLTASSWYLPYCFEIITHAVSTDTVRFRKVSDNTIYTIEQLNKRPEIQQQDFYIYRLRTLGGDIRLDLNLRMSFNSNLISLLNQVVDRNLYTVVKCTTSSQVYYEQLAQYSNTMTLAEILQQIAHGSYILNSCALLMPESSSFLARSTILLDRRIDGSNTKNNYRFNDTALKGKAVNYINGQYVDINNKTKWGYNDNTSDDYEPFYFLATPFKFHGYYTSAITDAQLNAIINDDSSNAKYTFYIAKVPNTYYHNTNEYIAWRKPNNQWLLDDTSFSPSSQNIQYTECQRDHRIWTHNTVTALPYEFIIWHDKDIEIGNQSNSLIKHKTSWLLPYVNFDHSMPDFIHDLYDNFRIVENDYPLYLYLETYFTDHYINEGPIAINLGNIQTNTGGYNWNTLCVEEYVKYQNNSGTVTGDKIIGAISKWQNYPLYCSNWLISGIQWDMNRSTYEYDRDTSRNIAQYQYEVAANLAFHTSVDYTGDIELVQFGDFGDKHLYRDLIYFNDLGSVKLQLTTNPDLLQVSTNTLSWWASTYSDGNKMVFYNLSVDRNNSDYLYYIFQVDLV